MSRAAQHAAHGTAIRELMGDSLVRSAAEVLLEDMGRLFEEEAEASERQAEINLELMRELEQVCEPCRALIVEAMTREAA